MQILIIRGLPGSGKSTLATKLANEAQQQAKVARVYEADNFFIGEDSTYRFDPAKIATAHYWCQTQVKRAIEKGVDLIIVSNTSTQAWEIEPYYHLYQDAVKNGLPYSFVIQDVLTDLTDEELAKRNVHGVPITAIARMRARWESQGTVMAKLLTGV